jgi:hypothetical protein
MLIYGMVGTFWYFQRAGINKQTLQHYWWLNAIIVSSLVVIGGVVLVIAESITKSMVAVAAVLGLLATLYIHVTSRRQSEPPMPPAKPGD